ncbi:nitrogenase stabilizing/protective protein NifW [Bradyrhizobium sp. CCGB20]|uniref:nitrogenase stabilizing/protective protein NifW n=1 Tax=Bradyrhizobium sp. CCGB20 TaxID=2949633 RepID=UPI0020B329CA|nr:nitrogenase stabilizing/protective protein NifW [Bradyrhizobium sp. CCGB20]MCP3397031.1 nitrogenase stabilizing/protective protein NifW [Bradyrhizobium sp. CCGB20]
MVDGVLLRLSKAAAAEEFFDLLGVKYDPNVVNVARLHILQRMGQYLADEDLTAASDALVAERCRAVLERAYADFVSSSPINQRVFKVLKEATAPHAKITPKFVQLDTFK